ncbi:zinc ribbon domain-containing protein [Shewanella goraebulensis]|uniref:zinc ribbon domain-containing protein n=1 Tax=Shewanella goraebulensis TaxID=3050637 RepID=UPI00254C253A|nr:zinc ribbon domain-containing protein [Shewanella goraebulensis]
MALIECPSCQKRISSKAKECSHCRSKTDGDNESVRIISHIQQSNKLMTQSFVFLTLFIAGVLIWFWGGETATGIQSHIATGCFVFGFVGYSVTRARIVLHKRKSV